MFAVTPDPPYTAVIFTSERTEGDHGYAAMAARLEELARLQPGYLGIESARETGPDGANIGITVSYWVDEKSALAWRLQAEHVEARRLGRAEWYARWQVRVATVTRAYRS